MNNSDPAASHGPALSHRRREDRRGLDESLHRGSPKHGPLSAADDACWMDGSLRSLRAAENAPTNRVKHLLLTKRRDVYVRHTADVSQVCDGRSLERLRRHSSEGSLPALDFDAGAPDVRKIGSKQPPRRQRGSRRPSVESAGSHSSHGTATTAASSASSRSIQQGKPPLRRRATLPPSIGRPGFSRAAHLPSAESSSDLSMLSAPDSSRVQLRKKHQPRHRCPSINGSVTGIVRPGRYSRSASASAASEDAGKPRRRRATLPASIGRPDLSGSFTQMTSGATEEDVDDKMLNLSLHSNASPMIVSAHSNEGWAPTGVDFSASMEVYVFHR